MKKTKIICTMGPNTNDETIMRQLVQKAWTSQDLTFHTAHTKNKKAVWTC